MSETFSVRRHLHQSNCTREIKMSAQNIKNMAHYRKQQTSFVKEGKEVHEHTTIEIINFSSPTLRPEKPKPGFHRKCDIHLPRCSFIHSTWLPKPHVPIKVKMLKALHLKVWHFSQQNWLVRHISSIPVYKSNTCSANLYWSFLF